MIDINDENDGATDEDDFFNQDDKDMTEFTYNNQKKKWLK